MAVDGPEASTAAPPHGHMSISGQKMDTFREYVDDVDIWIEAAPNLQQAVGDPADDGRATLSERGGKVIAERALRDVPRPVGVGRYSGQRAELVSANLGGVLPSPEQI